MPEHSRRTVKTSDGFEFVAKVSQDCSQATIDALGSAVQIAFGLASGQLKYAERMAETVRLHAKEAAELDQEIAAIRLMCPHSTH